MGDVKDFHAHRDADIEAARERYINRWKPEPWAEFDTRVGALPQPHWLVQDLILCPSNILIHGQPRVAKTWLALEVGISLALGEDPFAHERFQVEKPRRVLYVSEEDHEVFVRRRMRQIANGRTLRRFDLSIGKSISIDDPAWLRRLVDMTNELAYGLVILDPLRSLSLGIDQGPAKLAELTGPFLRQFTKRTESSLVCIHHDTKPQNKRGRDYRDYAQRSSGGGLLSMFDAPIHCSRIDAHHYKAIPSAWKHTEVDPAPFEMHSEKTPNGIKWTCTDSDTAEAEDTKFDRDVLDYIREHPEQSLSNISHGLRKDRQKVTGACERLELLGEVEMEEDGRAHRYHAVSADRTVNHRTRKK